MIKGIVFDLDGTLIDTAGVLAKAWENAFISEGVNPGYNELYEHTRGISSKDIIRKYTQMSSTEDITRIKEKRRENFLQIIKSGAELLYPETLDTIDKIKSKGIKIAIGTGMSFDLLKTVLKMTELEKVIDVVVSSDDVNEGKPAPDIFIEAFNRLKVDPKEGMVVGDSENDIIPGKKIGAFTVFISRSGEKLKLADKNINNLVELLNFI
ncbi:MAG: HAD family phosphatase [Candidatus Parvarchaeum sp.]